MPLISRLGAASSRGFGQLATQASGKYIEDYFSTYLYTGNGGSSQTINNGIGLGDTASWYSLVGYNVSTWSASGLTKDASGNVYTVNSPVGGGVVLTKFDSNNSIVWQRNLTGAISYGGSSKCVAVSSTGNVAVVGYASSGSPAMGYVFLYNSSGVLQWQKSVKDSSNTRATILYNVAFDSSGNVYCAGYSCNVSRPCLIKFDSSGTVLWQKNLLNGSFNLQNLACVVVDTSDNPYLFSQNFVGGYNNIVGAKYNSSGTLQWGTTFSISAQNMTLLGTTIDSSNNIIIGAFNALIKIDSTGTLVWKKDISNSGVYWLDTDSSNNIYVTGYNSIFKTDSSGAFQWGNAIGNFGSAGCVFANNKIYLNGTDTTNYTNAIDVVLPSDGSAISGAAVVTLSPQTVTITNNSTISQASGTGMTDDSTSSTIATSSNTDSAGSTTFTKYTQAAVTGAGGLVWLKGRNSSGANNAHVVVDTVRGRASVLQTYTTNPAYNSPAGTDLVSFNASGFSVGTVSNWNLISSSINYVAWTWKEAPKFFDIVTWTGDGNNDRVINHNLGSLPGMIIIKCSDAASNWNVYHRSIPNDIVFLERTDAAVSGGGFYVTATTTTTFTIGRPGGGNATGQQYVAYLFAHDAGGFGADGSQNVISCGSYAGNSSSNPINLGWEPQFILIKNITSVSSWYIQDTMRNMSLTNLQSLSPNTSSAEYNNSGPIVFPTATGFDFAAGGYTGWNQSGNNYIYMAIRRGPMRTPTSGTSVYTPLTSTSSSGTILTSSFPIDLQILTQKDKANYIDTWAVDRLRGVSSTSTASGQMIATNSTLAESTLNITQAFTNTSFTVPTYYSGLPMVWWNFARAPGFMDVVCWTGSGSSPYAVLHNLGVKPELVITKIRSASGGWYTMANMTSSGFDDLRLDQPSIATARTYADNAGFSSQPTATALNLDASSRTNAGGYTYVAYLFASCPGVSKVGTYSGTGSTQTINCGFTGGARFVLIKRLNGAYDWYVWDTARGMVSGTDPYLLLDSTNAEVNANNVYTATGGFQIVSTAAGINASGGTYLYLAIA